MTRNLLRTTVAAIAILLIASGCSSESNPDEIVLLTHDSFALSEGTLEAFTQETGVSVTVRTGGDAGTMLNQIILTRDNPIADVVYGIDSTFLSRAIAADIFDPHTAAGIENVNPLLRMGEGSVTPINFGDVCVNYDIDALESIGIPPPENLQDLVDPRYKDMLVVQDPATSSPGLAFLLATVAAYPHGGQYDWKAYWRDLFDNGVEVAADWSAAYYANFTRAGGEQPLVVSYASSPPAEVFFGDLDEAPTGVMTEGCYKQIEFAGVLAGTEHAAAARLLVDFLLSLPVQEDIPLNMFVYPANQLAELPKVFVDHSSLPEVSVVMEPGTIEENRERWIREWTEIARS